LGTRRRLGLAVGLALGLLLTLLLSPPPAAAQPATKVYRVGFLANALETSDGPLFAVFVDELRKLGYVEGQNLIIDWRSSEGDFARLPELAQDLIKQKVDVIVAASGPPARAAAEATQTIPVVFPVVAERAEEKLTARLGRPGSNVTGSTYEPQELNRQLLRLLKEAMPRASRLAVLMNPANSVHLQLVARDIPGAARPLKVTLLPVEVRSAGDLERALDAAVQKGADSLYVLGDPLSFINRTRIAELAAARRLPTIHTLRAGVEAGGLLSYGPRLGDLFRRAATHVDKILKGTKPADLPVERKPRFEVVINLRTARTLGVTLPPAVLKRADEVIQ
jgi:putative ABC transport system substrate-binding protein